MSHDTSVRNDAALACSENEAWVTSTGENRAHVEGVNAYGGVDTSSKLHAESVAKEEDGRGGVEGCSDEQAQPAVKLPVEKIE